MALINNPPLSEPMFDADGKARPAWAAWLMQSYRGSSFCGSGTTADRPALKKMRPGDSYFDISLGANGKPVFVSKTGTAWLDAAGNVV